MKSVMSQIYRDYKNLVLHGTQCYLVFQNLLYPTTSFEKSVSNWWFVKRLIDINFIIKVAASSQSVCQEFMDSIEMPHAMAGVFSSYRIN